jgi:hypothetical protein
MEGPGVINLFEGVLSHGREEEIQLFARISQLLWLHRNEFLHEGRFTNPNMLAQTAKSKVLEFNKVQEGYETEPESPREANMQTRKPPDAANPKANWDAAFNNKEGRMGMGVVIRDHEGGLRAAKCSFISGQI